MFEVSIFNGSLCREFKSRVRFPNWQDICGGAPPSVDMIVLSSGEVMFDINDIIFAINDYEAGLAGNNYIHVRDIVKTCSGFGSVVVFRRGGIFVDILAAQSIARRLFDLSPDASNYRRVVHPSVYQVLLDCPADKLAGLKATNVVSSDKFIRIVPSTLNVNKLEGVTGVPVVRSAEVSDDQEGAEESTVATTAKVSNEAPANTVNTLPVAESAIDTISQLSSLLSQLIQGKQLVIRIGIE